MKSLTRIALICTAMFLMAMVVGCPSSGFDRTTFDALATSNAVISQAQTDYESGALPHTTCVYNAINKAKAAQGVAETAFLAYYKVEEAKEKQAKIIAVAAKGSLPVPEGARLIDATEQHEVVGEPEAAREELSLASR